MTLGLFLFPILAGFAGTVLPAFGYLPALGGESFSVQAWDRLLAYPGVASSIFMTIWTGFTATAMSLLIAILFAASWRGSRVFSLLQRLLSPLLSVPHVAVALGLLFLLSPSGWIMRAVSPSLSGFTRPPDWATAPDQYGLAFVLALIVKETPFLFLMLLAALNQVREKQTVTVARSMGYGPVTAWLKCVLPLAYPQMRLPIYAVLAYSLSVIDVALVLAPATNPTLGVLILRWFNDPDLAFQFVAAAGAIAQMIVVVGGIAVWRLLEITAARLLRPFSADGARRLAEPAQKIGTLGITFILWLLGASSIFGMLIWSLARTWRFPDFLPDRWSVVNWVRRADDLADPAIVTIVVGAASAAIALVLTLACLENEKKHGVRPTTRALWLLYLPLLVPQIGFLFGAQILLLLFGADGGWLALIWSHLLFVLPYVFLSLSDPYRSLDDRYRRTALCLGVGPSRVFWRVTAPMLLRPILVAFAVGFAVSVAQYLPTIFAGGGRYTTLTTEAVASAGGGDRRLIGMLVFAQSILPFIGFLAAALIPAWLFRNRSGMKSAS